MPGFIATIGANIKAVPSTENNCIFNSIQTDKYYVEHRTCNKFLNDKFLFENDEYIYLLDGVVFNNHQLIDKYKALDWKDCVVNMHKQDPLTFYNEFRGSFLGLVYNKQNDSWLFYTDHVGDKQIFYTQLEDGGWLIGTEMSYMADTMHLNKQVMTPNRDAAYMVITLGYVIENNTLVNEIHKLVAGHYLVITNGKFQEIQYHRFSNTPVERSKEEMIEEIDRRFRNAVRHQFEKDKEYGYKHMACLSGGLDSRMTVWVAHELGYQRQLNMTFCQSNYTDFKVAQQIATDLRHDFMFKTLDGGNCIYDIDVVSKISFGMACFFGLSHTYSMFSKVNFKDYGIIHSGMIGDVVVGSYLYCPKYESAQITNGAYSEEVIDKLKSYQFKYTYPNSEIYMIYNRGFGFCGQGALAYGHTDTETYSPFYDVEFMEYCLSIPLEWRCGHKIYKEWILSKYPDAADYIWERIGKTIKDSLVADLKKPIVRHTMNIAGKEIPTPRDPYFGAYIRGFILRRLGIRKKVGKKNIIEKDSSKHTFMLDTKEHMNPVDYWYYGNPELRSFMDDYWNQNKNIIKDQQLLKDMMYLYTDCKATYDKLQPLTLLAAYKLLW